VPARSSRPVTGDLPTGRPTSPRPTSTGRVEPIGRTPGTSSGVPAPRTTTRSDGAVRPVGGTITRPSARTGTSNPTRREPGLTTRPTSTITTGPRTGSSATRRPATVEPRYAAPRTDAVRRPTATRPGETSGAGAARLAPRPTAAARDGATARPRPAPMTTTSGSRARAAATTPRLVPRSDAPRLAATRRSTSVVAGATARVSSSYCRPAYANCHPSVWCGYWSPWYGRVGYWNNCWPWYAGAAAWFWAPWYCYQTTWWNDCYSYAWYSNWAYPYGAAAGYWWYPSSTYCPIYLQVPSSVVVVESSAPAGETIVAGGPVIARSAELATPDDGRGVPADALAGKYVELGRLYFGSGRFAEAAEAYGKARSHAPDDAPLHFELADAVFAIGDYHYAAFLIAEAIRLDPGLAGATADKRRYYGETKLFDAHMEALDGYLASRPYDAQAHLVRGYNLRFSDRADQARAAFQRVLEITPENRAAQAFLSAPAPAAAEPTMR
jgi:hypothetical protein